MTSHREIVMANADKGTGAREQQDGGRRQRQQPAQQQRQGRPRGAPAGGRSGQQIERGDEGPNTGKGAGQPGASSR
jgi:hypothetical protein